MFSEKFSKLRSATGLNQTQFAKKAGVQRNSICDYENGRTHPTPETKKKLAAALHLKYEDFITIVGNEDEKPYKKENLLNFGRKLVALRMGKNLMQSELADKVKIGKSLICDYEKGRTLPSMKTQLKIAQALDLSHDEFLERTGLQRYKTSEDSIKIQLKILTKRIDALAAISHARVDTINLKIKEIEEKLSSTSFPSSFPKIDKAFPKIDKDFKSITKTPNKTKFGFFWLRTTIYGLLLLVLISSFI